MIPRVTITVETIPDIMRLFVLSPRLAANRARSLGKEVLGVYTEAFRYEAPRKKGAPSRTGGLKRGIAAHSEDTGQGMVGEVRMPHYGIFTIPPGTRPHEITPRPPKRALKFFWQKGGTTVKVDRVTFHAGKTVFFRRVWHPGYRGDPWPDRAMKRAERKVLSIVQRAGASVLIEPARFG